MYKIGSPCPRTFRGSGGWVACNSRKGGWILNAQWFSTRRSLILLYIKIHGECIGCGKAVIPSLFLLFIWGTWSNRICPPVDVVSNTCFPGRSRQSIFVLTLFQRLIRLGISSMAFLLVSILQYSQSMLFWAHDNT